jgi:MinD-like ATPase involved in chromosome partitioning or flagellar assembly
VAKIISVHSFRGGTGKSNISANLGTALALTGKRVGVVDTDIQSPGIHVLFGMPEERMSPALNDFLWGKCTIEAAAHDVSPPEVRAAGGLLLLVPSSIKAGEIARVLREGYEVARLNEGFHTLVHAKQLDYLLIDTHPGLNDETLMSIAISDELLLVLRPDQQDFQGTAVTAEVARRLGVPSLLLVVNKHASWLDRDDLRRQVEAIYGAPVAGLFAHSDEMLALQSGGIFLLHHPGHAFSQGMIAMARRIAGEPAMV